ncbi:MAG: GntR family transcriptional regulator [Clostridiales bacterium]|nr:GntR family transcriptional regulator [Clostridiales bacterium]
MTATKDTGLKYQKMKKYIIDQINNKVYKPNERIPSENELSKLLGFSIITVRKAMAELVNENIIYRVQGKGSFVVDTNKIAASKRIAALIMSGNGPYDSSLLQIIKGIQTYFKKENYSLIVESSDSNIEKEKKIIDDLVGKGVQGIILYSSNPDANIISIKRMREMMFPLVLIDRYIEEYPINYVCPNNFAGAFSATEYLLKSGHKKIAFVAYEFYLSSEKERFKGYCKAMEDFKVDVNPELLFTEHDVDFERMLNLIREEQLTAIFAANDRRALELMDLLSRNNIRIPDDVSIIGFDDCENIKYAKISLSTVRQDFIGLGYEAANILLETIKNPDMEYKVVMLPTKLIIRDSTKNIK